MAEGTYGRFLAAVTHLYEELDKADEIARGSFPNDKRMVALRAVRNAAIGAEEALIAYMQTANAEPESAHTVRPQGGTELKPKEEKT